jgi:uncharacterized phiE125 gp8 family phage protein
MMTSLRVITPPNPEPVSVETLKEHLRIDLTTEDALLETYLSAAREQGEELSRRAFITQTLEMTVDEWPHHNFVLALLRPPLQSVTSVTYTDIYDVSRTFTDYRVDTASEPGRIIFNSLPGEPLRESGAITVRYVAGYGDTESDVPGRIKQTLMQLVGHWYEHRESLSIPLELKQAFMTERVVWF